VFGDSDDAPADAAAQTAAWDRIKQAERGGAPQSVLDGVPGSLPSLAHAHATQRKAAKVGFDWPDISGAIAKVTEETAELETEITVGDPDRMTDELGDVLFAVVNVARHLGIEPETALRAATSKFSRRFRIVEQLARDRGIELHASELVVLDGLWDEAKLRTNLPEG
jgi:MazG family protein